MKHAAGLWFGNGSNSISRQRFFCLIFLLLICGFGCKHIRGKKDLHRFQYAELHMGTVFKIVLYAPDEPSANKAAEAAFTSIAYLDSILSDYRATNELRKVCQSPPGIPVQVSPDFIKVTEKAQELSKRSGGAFDVTVGPMVQLWRAARKTLKMPTLEAIENAKARIGYTNLVVDERHCTITLKKADMGLDFGGVAKGYAADQALLVIKKMGFPRAMVAASGDIALGDPPPEKKGWVIGIQSIDHPEEGFTGSAVLRNAGISTSGDTEQFVEIEGNRYSHIVNPKTGIGLVDRIGVTIIAPNATLSDGLATAVSVLGTKKGLELVDKWPGISALIIKLESTNKIILKSKRFQSNIEKQYLR